MVGEEIRLLGKVIITGKIETRTGLSIGGSRAGLEIGGVDNPVIKDVEGKPYIPGSSLKGKMR
ncbi:MAG: type III-A CRISPR-associated RAMP protein Csm3, partial [Thermoplasmata archaeon]